MFYKSNTKKVVIFYDDDIQLKKCVSVIYFSVFITKCKKIERSVVSYTSSYTSEKKVPLPSDVFVIIF